MNTLMKVILFVVVVGLTGFGFYVSNYQAKNQQITANQQQVEVQKKELERLKTMASKLAEWEKAKKEFGELLAGFQKGLALKDFIPSFLTDIERLTAEERVRMNDPSFKILTLTPGPSTTTAPAKKPEEEKKEGKEGAAPAPKPAESAPVGGAQKVAIQMTYEGRFGTLVDFFQQLAEFKLNKLVTVQRLALNPKGEKMPGRAPVLTITLPMEAFMFGEGGGK